MVKQRSPRAGPAERSSGCHTLPEGIASRIALPITLLASWLIIWALLSSILSLQVPSPHLTQLRKDRSTRRNYTQDRFNLPPTNKNHVRNNRSVIASAHYSIFTPRRRSKYKSPISMSGGQEERETKPAKVGSMSQDQGGSNGDNTECSSVGFDSKGEKSSMGNPTTLPFLKGRGKGFPP
jgi:hypothetical protein